MIWSESLYSGVYARFYAYGKIEQVGDGGGVRTVFMKSVINRNENC